MASTLKIIKKSSKVFWHIHNNLDAQKYAISDFEISLDGDNFKIVEIDGAKRYNYLVQNITIIDETDAGTIEDFNSAEDFYNRLITIQYTPFYNPLATSPADNKIVSQAGFYLSGTNLNINANWIWKLSGVTYSNPSNVFIGIPYCAEGQSRIDYIVPNYFNGFTRISGVETTGILVAPQIPNENMYVTYFIVTDSAIGEPSIPITGDHYITKIEKSSLSIFGTGLIDNLELTNFRSCLKFSDTITGLNSISFPDALQWLYDGKDFLLDNNQEIPITLFHNNGSGYFKLNFPDSQNFILKPNNRIHFRLRLLSSLTGIFDYVGYILPPSYINDFTSAPDQQEFEIPTGYTINSVFLNRTFLTTSEYTFIDNILTIIETLEPGTIISTR